MYGQRGISGRIAILRGFRQKTCKNANKKRPETSNLWYNRVEIGRRRCILLKTVGERIYDLREDESTTIRDQAKELQISESQLSRIESGKTATISSDILTGLAKHFHVSTDYILGLSPVRQNTFILSDLHLTETACVKLARKEIDGDTLSRLMEHKDFARLIKSTDAYLNDTNVEGVTFRNDMLKMYASMAREHADDFEHSGDVRQSANTVLAARTGAHELEISDIQNLTMRILKETKATVEEEKLAQNPVMRKFANKEFEAKLCEIAEQSNTIKDPEERLDYIVDQTLEAVQGQSGVKAFFLKPFKPLLRKIIKKTGIPEAQNADEQPDDSEEE